MATHRDDWPAAIERWTRVQASLPDNPAGYFGMAFVLRASQRLDAAEAFLQQAVARFPDDAALACEQAWVAIFRADWDVALERWQLVRARFPHHPTGYAGLARVLRERGDTDAAERIIEEAIEALPEKGGPLLDHAATANRRRDWGVAVERWARLRARFPQELSGYTGAALALRELRQFDAADALLDKAMRRFPQQVQAIP